MQEVWSLISTELTGTAWKISEFGVFSGLYFPESGLGTKSKYGKIRTRIKSELNISNKLDSKTQVEVVIYLLASLPVCIQIVRNGTAALTLQR